LKSQNFIKKLNPIALTTLLEKMKPKYYIEGYYNTTCNALKQEFVTIKYSNLKNFIFDVDKTYIKIGLEDASAIYQLADKTMDIKTDDFIWAEGTGTYYEKAEEKALQNVLKKIAATQQSKFLTVKPSSSEISDFSEDIIETYSNSISEKLESKVLTDEPGNSQIIKYISNDEMQYIFDQREIFIKDYLQLGKVAETELRIADALRNYYRALVLLYSHPDYSTMRYNFGSGDLVLYMALNERIKSIFDKLEITDSSVETISDVNSNFYVDFTYNSAKIQNITYRYWTGTSYSSPVSAKNGKGFVEIYGAGAASTENLKFRIDYMFTSDQEDMAYTALLDIIEAPVFSGAEIIVPVKTAKQKNIAEIKPITFETVTKQVATSEKIETNTTSELKAEEYKPLETNVASVKVKTICTAINNSTYESVENLFTTDGYEMFLKLVKDGNAKVLNFNEDFELVELNNGATFRSVSMKLTYGSKIML